MESVVSLTIKVGMYLLIYCRKSGMVLVLPFIICSRKQLFLRTLSCFYIWGTLSYYLEDMKLVFRDELCPEKPEWWFSVQIGGHLMLVLFFGRKVWWTDYLLLWPVCQPRFQVVFTSNLIFLWHLRSSVSAIGYSYYFITKYCRITSEKWFFSIFEFNYLV